ncbi:LAETG motif-containing sortase-dependent surface protein [Streptomyces sp. NPDC002994]|uniref:LAETG motif-containing sortase-dependent surface protein n=1 Tax=Streptomyces sp. NPDC002994 TaxID=3154441 RepID=UPI0033B5FBB6
MKLRRAMALAAATAVIAPAALLAAPAAYAEGEPTTTSQTETTDPGEATDPGATDPAEENDPVDATDPSETDPGEATDPGATDPSEEEPPTDPGTDPATDPAGDPDPSDTDPSVEEPPTDPGTDPVTDPAGDPDPATDPAVDPGSETDPEGEEDPGQEPVDPEPGTEPGDEDPDTDPGEDDWGICENSDLELAVKGLPGKIAAGSGWRQFSLNVYNSSDTDVSDVYYFAGASFDKDGMELIKSRQVTLQAYNEELNTWDDLVDQEGNAVGYVGESSKIEAGYEVDIKLRLNVKASAPAGTAFTLGAGFYTGDEDCAGFADVSYKFEIVAAGTDTEGTKPTEGGKAPVPSEKPTESTVPAVTGALAETGSSSAVPMFALAGGAAVALGVGAMFVVRRRQAGSEA